MKIAVGGMIASGKSTLVNKLGEILNLPVMDEYEKDDGVFDTLLTWLYEGKPNVEMLLQVYFLHNHWDRQIQHGKDFIVDRDLIEHWLFADTNLKHQPDVLSFYNGLFQAYMNRIHKPDLYIILDISWERFVDRIFTRGRKAEIDNFAAQEQYFKNLLSTYVSKMKAQCIIHGIDYVVIDTNDLNENQVLEAAIQAIEHRKQLKGE